MMYPPPGAPPVSLQYVPIPTTPKPQEDTNNPLYNPFKPVEDMLGTTVLTTAFVGSIDEGISDEILDAILNVSIFYCMSWLH
jgi:hypothetical protein